MMRHGLTTSNHCLKQFLFCHATMVVCTPQAAHVMRYLDNTPNVRLDIGMVLPPSKDFHSIYYIVR